MATEAFRKEISRQLTELQDGTGPAFIEFAPTLNSEERKYVHNLCHQFGLKSKSKGSGAKRFLTVSRKEGVAPPVVAAVQGGTAGGGGSGQANGQVRPPASGGAPFRLPPPLARHECLEQLPECPETWELTGPADLWQVRGAKGGKGGGRPGAKASPPTRAALDASEAARVGAQPSYKAMQKSRHELPAWGCVDKVLAALQASRVVLVAGETGCGKSTQVPQFLLDAAPSSRIVVTQPRRIAAVSLAQRVAQERCEAVGKAVGYTIHMERKTSAETRCTFCTTGVLRRRLLTDAQLSGLTHVIVDEVHERELHSDFLLVVLKQLMEERKDLRLVLMSATLQLEVFQNFFPGCRTVQIPGRTFPVQHLYLEELVGTLHKTPRFRTFLGPAFAAAGNVKDEKDFKRQVAQQENHPDQVAGYGQYLSQPMTKERLADGCYKHDVLQQGRGTAFDVPIIDALILFLDEEHKKQERSSPGLQPGAILVFLPGWGDIDRAKRRLRDSLDSRRFLVLPCHSQVRPEQQREIFKRPPTGVRKIILASNIAETSITIDDVTVVIDTGRAKETSYDPYLKVGTLATTFVSKASAAQRAGRAGRTQAGTCYHLFSRSRHEQMEQFRAPELLRSPLEDVCLHTAHLIAQRNGSNANRRSSPGIDEITDWLSQAPQPPEAVAVKNAVELLKVLGALTPAGVISRLGVKFANLPLPATMARSVVWAALLGCLDPVLTILCASSGRDPFQLPQDAPGTAQGLGSRGSSWSALSRQLFRLKRELIAPMVSDHIALLRAVERYEEAKRSGGAASAKRICERFSLSFRAVDSVIEMRNKMRHELQQQRLLSPETMAFANRHSDKEAVVLAVIAAGVFPNVAARRAVKKKIEVNGGRVDAGMHPQCVLDTGGGKGGGGKGGGAGALAPEWLCYTEMTQVEERYSITGVSYVSPLTLLLLCGDDPLEVHGGEADVSLCLLGGWVHFIVPQEQAERLQALRYALRQAFLAYCEAPAKCQEHDDILECAVACLEKSMDSTGKPTPVDPGYRPKAPAQAQNRGPARPVGRLASAATAGAAAGAPPSAASASRHAPVVAASVPALPEGQELASVQQLVISVYGQAPAGKRLVDWSFEAQPGDRFQGTLTVAAYGVSYTGDVCVGKKAAMKSAARVAWAALHAQSSSGAAEDGFGAEGPEDATGEVEMEEGGVLAEDGLEEEVLAEEEEEVPAEASQGEDAQEAWEGGEEAAEEADNVHYEVLMPEEYLQGGAGEEEAAAEEAVEAGQAMEEDEEEEVWDVPPDEDDATNGACELEEDEGLDDLGEASAALRFLQGDLNYMESAGALEEEPADAFAAPAPSAKRRRVC